MRRNEMPMVFDCQGDQLLGIVHLAEGGARVGVLIVVGGPQYRVGSHRQFVLLARYLASHGIPAMRFDVRGMGDSKGGERRFDQLDADIRSAVDCFMASVDLKSVVIWGLCDAASAALFYAYQDHRVAGLVLLNPWVFTEQGSAKTFLRHYYLQRFLSSDFWRKVFLFKFDFIGAIVSFADILKKVVKGPLQASAVSTSSAVHIDDGLPLPVRMRECFKQFGKPVLLILSGRDLTADEFRLVVADDSVWQALLSDPLVTKRDFPEADHTFSSAEWRDRVADWSVNWIRAL
ncbi:hydrolase 1, exosortase A system-associated [Methylomonas sp. SURF-2]|uniref:Hydrolase 1, exosortase A system-associated n=1 Tax=Methylomonas subterranea TaxID=2952225 RepID=A0ABT1TCB5_9GAMM|nr:hydrolase 1, exosortase A system-associated [Methylomonas sp. SURF-2]MCQ8103109.1 hydrolase 1, exosortase A system-associated [Methylomonas sp. SURF-2]